MVLLSDQLITLAVDDINDFLSSISNHPRQYSVYDRKNMDVIISYMTFFIRLYSEKEFHLEVFNVLTIKQIFNKFSVYIFYCYFHHVGMRKADYRYMQFCETHIFLDLNKSYELHQNVQLSHYVYGYGLLPYQKSSYRNSDFIFKYLKVNKQERQYIIISSLNQDTSICWTFLPC